MNPSQSYPGYAQIIELMNDRILMGQYLSDERVPSVRDMAMEMEVNPITVTRAYERLQRAGVIYTQRGLGYFVTPGAVDQIRQQRMARFSEEVLPAFVREVRLLGLSVEDVCQQLQASELSTNHQ